MYVGILTADEVVYADGKVYVENSNYYLMGQPLSFITLSPKHFSNDGTDCVFIISTASNAYGSLQYFAVAEASTQIRPSICSYLIQKL